MTGSAHLKPTTLDAEAGGSLKVGGQNKTEISGWQGTDREKTGMNRKNFYEEWGVFIRLRLSR